MDVVVWRGSGVRGAAKGFNGGEIENGEKKLVGGASRGLELAKCASVSNTMFQNLLESSSLHDPELERSDGVGSSGHHVAIVHERSVHEGAALSQNCILHVTFDFPEDDVVAWLVGHVGVAGEVNYFGSALTFVAQQLGPSFNHHLKILLRVLVDVYG